jgi:hypothetical protein
MSDRPTLPRTLVDLVGGFSLASLVAAGVIAHLTVAFVGPPLAMLGRMYGGELEPRTPNLAYPWLGAVLLALLPALPAAHRRWTLATGAVVPFLLLPFWQLWALWAAT